MTERFMVRKLEKEGACVCISVRRLESNHASRAIDQRLTSGPQVSWLQVIEKNQQIMRFAVKRVRERERERMFSISCCR